MKNQSHKLYIYGITLVAALGGLLFGYDTAVISGTTEALDNFFIRPLLANPLQAGAVVTQYKIIVSLCFLAVGLLAAYFLFKLYEKKRATIYTALVAVVAILLWYFNFWNLPNVLTENMASAIKGFTISSALVGCIVGGALGGYVSQSIGRKQGLMLAAILFTLSALGSSIPDKMNFIGVEMISSLIFYRIIGGIGVGIASMLAPMYIAEVAPAAHRGRLVSLNQFAIIFGMLVVYFANYFIASQGDYEWLNTIGWRWMFASELIPCILFFTLLFFVPKTPRYLMLKGKEQEATQVLTKLYGAKVANEEVELIRDSLVEKNAHWLSYGALVIVIGILISFFQQAVGINVVLYYAPEIFRTMGADTDASLLQTIIVGIINLSFTVVAILTVDRFGRKPLMIIGALGMAVSMFALGMTFYMEKVGMGSLIFMLLYTASFAVSWGPVAWVLLSEIFPNSIRGAMSIAIAAQWLSNLIVSWTFPMMNENSTLTNLFHHGFAYWIYAVMAILAAAFIWRYVPETKGRSLENMEKLWKK
ncbi:MAG: D-xylose transporter XylE [Odoribacter sp.]|nr:D-xylose transporter XylE [Odoribacter sp.]